jgi:hypothetical protein
VGRRPQGGISAGSTTMSTTCSSTKQRLHGRRSSCQGDRRHWSTQLHQCEHRSRLQYVHPEGAPPRPSCVSPAGAPQPSPWQCPPRPDQSASTDRKPAFANYILWRPTTSRGLGHEAYGERRKLPLTRSDMLLPPHVRKAGL